MATQTYCPSIYLRQKKGQSNRINSARDPVVFDGSRKTLTQIVSTYLRGHPNRFCILTGNNGMCTIDAIAIMCFAIDNMCCLVDLIDSFEKYFQKKSVPESIYVQEITKIPTESVIRFAKKYLNYMYFHLKYGPIQQICNIQYVNFITDNFASLCAYLNIARTKEFYPTWGPILESSEEKKIPEGMRDMELHFLYVFKALQKIYSKNKHVQFVNLFDSDYNVHVSETGLYAKKKENEKKYGSIEEIEVGHNTEVIVVVLPNSWGHLVTQRGYRDSTGMGNEEKIVEPINIKREIYKTLETPLGTFELVAAHVVTSSGGYHTGTILFNNKNKRLIYIDGLAGGQIFQDKMNSTNGDIKRNLCTVFSGDDFLREFVPYFNTLIYKKKIKA